MNPEAIAISERAQALLAQGAYEAAEQLIRPLLASGRGPLPLWRLLVSAIRPQGRILETLRIQQMLVDTVPGHLPSRFDLAETLLLRATLLVAGGNIVSDTAYRTQPASPVRFSVRFGWARKSQGEPY